MLARVVSQIASFQQQQDQQQQKSESSSGEAQPHKKKQKPNKRQREAARQQRKQAGQQQAQKQQQEQQQREQKQQQQQQEQQQEQQQQLLDGVLAVIDMFKSAALLARERDLQAEAQALSRLGHTYKVGDVMIMILLQGACQFRPQAADHWQPGTPIHYPPDSTRNLSGWVSGWMGGWVGWQPLS